MAPDGSDSTPGRGRDSRVEPGGAEPPQVKIPAELVRRAARFAAALSAASSRDEVGGRRSLAGVGEEFVGHRPYRPGEDLRHLDWTLLGRHRQPFVKVHRPSRRETWLVAFDVSPSMDVGAPSKLQSAAEAALAAVALGLRHGARVEVVVPDPGGAAPFRSVELAGEAALGQLVRALEELRPAAGGGLEVLLAGDTPVLARVAARTRAQRVLLFGDFLDVDLRALLGLAGSRRRLHIGHVVAPEEADPTRDPGAHGAPRWFDPEDPAAPERRASARDLRLYHQRFEGFCERLERLARQHRMGFAAWTSTEPFEQHVPELLR